MDAKIRVIIAGGRDFKPAQKHRDRIKHLLKNYTPQEVEVVSGGARGADKFGESVAKENGYSLKVFPADWDKFGKSAGHIRNREMGDYADFLIAFWDGVSKGTKGMIEYMEKLEKPVWVVNYRS